MSKQSWHSKVVRPWAPRLWRAAIVPVQEEPDYLAAIKYKESFNPASKDAQAYSWVMSYAEWLYDRSRDRCEALDAKADSLTKFFGTSAGLLVSGLVLATDRLGWPCLFVWLFAAILAMIGLAFAALARRPGSSFMPPTIADAIRYQEYYAENGDLGRTNFVAQWHVASVGQRLVGDRKATWVAHATNFAILALVVFGCAAVCAAIPFIRNYGLSTVADEQPNQQTTDEQAKTTPSPQSVVQPQIVQEQLDPKHMVGPQHIQASDPGAGTIREIRE